MAKQLYRFEEVAGLKGQLGSFDALASIVGLKAANLSDVNELGVKIPDGIVLTSESYKAFIDSGSIDIPEELWEDFLQALKPIEEATGLKYGSPKTPLLLSVRGDASKYMVGMLDAVTHVGLNDLTARALERTSLNRAYVWDCYRRLVQGYGTVVLKIPASEFEYELEQFKKAKNIEMWSAFTALDYIELTKINKAIIAKKTGRPFPQDPFEQLRRVMTAVFGSIGASRASQFKKLQPVGEISGAMTVMPMVFGNNGFTSISAVLISRDAVTGDAKINGRYTVNATVDDVASGARDTLSLDLLAKENASVHRELTEIVKKVEKHFAYPVIMDFIVTEGKIHCLQVVRAQLTAAGRFKAARDMVAEGIITKMDGLAWLEPADLMQMLTPQVADASKNLLAKGVAAGREAIVGKLCLTPEEVFAGKKANQKTVYVRNALIPADLDVFLAATAVVTTTGSNVSFAAALSRLFRKPAALACDGLEIDYAEKSIKGKDGKVASGEIVTVTGCGCLLKGEHDLKTPEALDDVNAKEVLAWADEVRKDKFFVFTTAETTADVKVAADIESDGVGLFTIEKFFDGENKQIIAALAKGFSDDAIAAFEKHLTEKLTEVFEAAGSKAVTVRLFDPAPAEYTPCPCEIAKEIGALRAKEGTEAEVTEKRKQLKDAMKESKLNTTFGCRAVRLCLVQPAFMKAQFKAILGAVKAAKGKGGQPTARILAPFVTDANEMKQLIKAFDAVAIEMGERAQIGARIETPRACLTTGKIVESCDFIDIATELVTELMFGMNKEDAAKKLLPKYEEMKVLKADVLEGMEMETVGMLVKKSISVARETKNDAKIGIFSDEFNDPAAVKRYTELGVNSFICRPAAVPIARLCAAKTLLK